jgi:hypothetical protein
VAETDLFKWRRDESEIILLCVRWSLRYALSYRDLEEMMEERNLTVGYGNDSALCRARHKSESLPYPVLAKDKWDTVRLRVLAYFIEKYSVEELERLLERYFQRYSNGETYYYDVVCWLDRVLYAPTRLKETYRHLLLTPVLDLTTPVELSYWTAAEFY